jgi:integrase/recombinase XerD
MNVQKKDKVLAFLNTKIKNRKEDPDERWVTTWNDYLWRIKYFYRWIYKIKRNIGNENSTSLEPSSWITSVLVQINKIKTKRLSPYLQSEVWDTDEIVCICTFLAFLLNTSKALVIFRDENQRIYVSVWNCVCVDT